MHFANYFGNILKIIHLTSYYPLPNASCSHPWVLIHGFSSMGRIRTDWRCRLANDTVDMLMRVETEGLEQLAKFNPRPAVLRWWNDRGRHPNTVPYGARV